MYLLLCDKKMPLLDCINQISKYTMCTCCSKLAGLFFHMLFDIERELLLLQLSGENSVSVSLSRHPGYQKITEIPHFDFLTSFGCNEQTIHLMHTRFRLPGSKNDKPLSGRPMITAPLVVRVIVKSI